jgi:secreted trypsin-like serine protease
MFRLVCLLAIASVTLAVPLDSPILRWDERIVGGANAKDGDAPYQVSLRYSSTPSFHFCGASIISSRWLLCAAHCTTGRTPASTLAVVGSVLNNPIGKTYKLSQIINHPNYNPNTIANDVSVLQTSEDIAFGSLVQPVPLTDFEVGGDQLVILTGWGQLSVS